MYGAPTVTEAEAALERFALTWDSHYPTISTSWRRDWTRLTVFFDYLPAIRKAVYTTKDIEKAWCVFQGVSRDNGIFDQLTKVPWFVNNFCPV